MASVTIRWPRSPAAEGATVRGNQFAVRAFYISLKSDSNRNFNDMTHVVVNNTNSP
jgi:hypothetical protein